MTIWDYASQTKDALMVVMRSPSCVFCKSAMHRFAPVEDQKAYGDREEWKVRVCQVCGWWKVEHWHHAQEGNLYLGSRDAAAGSLRQLDLTNIETPLTAVRNFLAARYEARFSVNPFLFEEVVGDVFKDLGYSVLVTNRSGDDGIDVLLHGKDGKVIGVQVKRYRNSIKVSQLRELLGALVVKNLTNGMFVTTSEFQSGASETIRKAEASGYAINLVNGRSFFEALSLAQRRRFEPEDVHKVIQRAAFTRIGDTGTRYTGLMGEIYNPDYVKRVTGTPSGPQDEWP